jgi:hypothetical protein
MKHKRELQINTNTPAEVSNETRAEYNRLFTQASLRRLAGASLIPLVQQAART